MCSNPRLSPSKPQEPTGLLTWGLLLVLLSDYLDDYLERMRFTSFVTSAMVMPLSVFTSAASWSYL